MAAACADQPVLLFLFQKAHHDGKQSLDSGTTSIVVIYLSIIP